MAGLNGPLHKITESNGLQDQTIEECLDVLKKSVATAIRDEINCAVLLSMLRPCSNFFLCCCCFACLTFILYDIIQRRLAHYYLPTMVVKLKRGPWLSLRENRELGRSFFRTGKTRGICQKIPKTSFCTGTTFNTKTIFKF